METAEWTFEVRRSGCRREATACSSFVARFKWLSIEFRYFSALPLTAVHLLNSADWWRIAARRSSAEASNSTLSATVSLRIAYAESRRGRERLFAGMPTPPGGLRRGRSDGASQTRSGYPSPAQES